MIDAEPLFQWTSIATEFVEHGNFGSLCAIALVGYFACGCASEAIVSVHRASSKSEALSVQEPQSLAIALSSFVFVGGFIYLAEDFSGDAVSLLGCAVRSFLASRIVCGCLAVTLSILFVCADRLQRIRANAPSFAFKCANCLKRLRSLLPRWPFPRKTKPDPDLPDEIRVQMELEEARHQYQTRCDMLTSTPLDQLELQAVRNNLKQEYLRKMRRILCQGDDR